MYTYQCRYCGSIAVVFPPLDLGDGYHELELRGWDIERMACARCVAEEADAMNAARNRAALEVDTPLGEGWGG